MSTKTINAFVDLDETLIHTLGFKTVVGDMEEQGNLEFCDKPVTISLSKKEHYTTILRPGANYLLFRLRELAHVYMLTRATEDYAQAMNKAFNFGFTEDRIFDRKFIEKPKYNIPKSIAHGRNFLIDDLDTRDNFEKITFIKKFGKSGYIQIPAFWGFREESLTHQSIEDIIETIIKNA
jgi:NLI interacting factor-like phosphatase